MKANAQSKQGSSREAEGTDSANGGDGLAITHFNFTHQVFQAPGARFVLKGQSQSPTFRVAMGDLDGLIDISVLKKEFHIEPDSHDGKLLELAIAGLRYVPDIKPNDSIPSELLNGKASWSVNDKHKRVAELRLQVQLLSWVSGKEVLITDPAEIESFLGQIENREKLKSAFKNAAAALGVSDAEMVIRQLELLARELCYIEALRDRFALIPRLAAKMTELAKSFGGDRNAKMELARVQSLLQVGIKEYSAMFAEADAQTGEIISALKTIDRQVKYIRSIRDDLHFLLMQWEPSIKALPAWRATRTPETDKALSDLYRFLAPRYTSGRSLLKRRDPDADGKGKSGRADGRSSASDGSSAKPSSTTTTSPIPETKGEMQCQ